MVTDGDASHPRYSPTFGRYTGHSHKFNQNNNIGGFKT